MLKKIITVSACVVALTQCNTLESDCRAIAQREAQIAQETPGDYYIGRRYYVPSTRFWGYVRRPQQSWREAKLVMMDESKVRTPDRGWEDPHPQATYGKDNNTEYVLTGRLTEEKVYDPGSNQVLPLFCPTSYTVRNKKPGFLFKPSEEYSTTYVTLYPAVMPTPQQVMTFGQMAP